MHSRRMLVTSLAYLVAVSTLVVMVLGCGERYPESPPRPDGYGIVFNVNGALTASAESMKSVISSIGFVNVNEARGRGYHNIAGERDGLVIAFDIEAVNQGQSRVHIIVGSNDFAKMRAFAAEFEVAMTRSNIAVTVARDI